MGVEGKKGMMTAGGRQGRIWAGKMVKILLVGMKEKMIWGDRKLGRIWEEGCRLGRSLWKAGRVTEKVLVVMGWMMKATWLRDKQMRGVEGRQLELKGRQMELEGRQMVKRLVVGGRQMGMVLGVVGRQMVRVEWVFPLAVGK